ncbi:MAG: hypothetical protein R3E48_21850 [Burkholderiaceae bacterium]
MALQGDAWAHDHEIFDDAYVAKSRFFQEFAIPYGYRYMSATKIVDDARHVVLFGAIRTAASGPLKSAR